MLEKIRVLAAAALAAAFLALPARAAGGYRIGVLDGLVALWDGGGQLCEVTAIRAALLPAADRAALAAGILCPTAEEAAARLDDYGR